MNGLPDHFFQSLLVIGCCSSVSLLTEDKIPPSGRDPKLLALLFGYAPDSLGGLNENVKTFSFFFLTITHNVH